MPERGQSQKKGAEPREKEGRLQERGQRIDSRRENPSAQREMGKQKTEDAPTSKREDATPTGREGDYKEGPARHLDHDVLGRLKN